MRDAACRLLAALLLVAGAARADSGSDWFDAQTQELRQLLEGQAAPAPGRARFLACGYVSPGIAAVEAAKSDGDTAFAHMLARLRMWLARFAEAP